MSIAPSRLKRCAAPLGGGEGGNSKATLCPPKPEPLRGDVEVSDRRESGWRERGGQ